MLHFSRRSTLAGLGGLALWPWPPVTAQAAPAGSSRLQSWPLNTPQPTGIHDVAPAPDGGVWFTAQRSGQLGWFDPSSGRYNRAIGHAAQGVGGATVLALAGLMGWLVRRQRGRR